MTLNVKHILAFVLVETKVLCLVYLTFVSEFIACDVPYVTSCERTVEL